MRNEIKSAFGGKKIVVSENGPYAVGENVSLCEEKVISDENNDPLRWEKKNIRQIQEQTILQRNASF